MPRRSIIPKARFPRPRVIYCDVDGTLLVGGEINLELVAWLRRKKEEGFELVIWSARGKQHAEDIVARAGIGGIVQAVLSKPGYVVDDKGWGWRVFTKVFRTNQDLGEG